MEARKPNILLLFTDQQRYDTVAAAGFPNMKTPNLDRLVNEGCLFTHAHTPSPICIPARNCMLTGTRDRAHGYFGVLHEPIRDPDIPTYPKLLGEAGYYSGAVGMPEAHHGINWVTNRSIQFIEENKHRPFLLKSSWIKPHPPWNIPAEWQNHYDDVVLPEPIPVSREFPYHSENSDWFGDDDSDEHRKEIRKAYFTTISMIDKGIGKILDCLEENGILDITIIVFTSDHGEMLQDKGFYEKKLPYESSSHIPFIIRYPERVEPGSKDDRFVDLMDVMPAMLDAAGVDLEYKGNNPDYRQAGDSLFRQESPHRERDYQYVEIFDKNSRWASVRDKRYKYVYFFNGGYEQLFDLQEDPQEITNLLKWAEYPQEAYDRLRQKCLEMEAEWGPEGVVKDGQFISFPAEELHPFDNNRFPLWSNMQFQEYGDKSADEEVATFLTEREEAVAHYGDPDYLKNVFPNEEYQQNFDENLEKFRTRLHDLTH